MKLIKKMLLLVLPCLAAALSAPALADIPAVPSPLIYSSGVWQLCLAIGVCLIAAAVLVILLIKRKKQK